MDTNRRNVITLRTHALKKKSNQPSEALFGAYAAVHEATLVLRELELNRAALKRCGPCREDQPVLSQAVAGAA